MSRWDCADFEAALARALAAPHPADDGTIASLRSHAASCAACRAAAALVDLAAAALEDRDPIADPGAEYWSEFERRLAARLRAERPGRLRLRALAWLGAATAAAAAVVAAALLATPQVKPPEVARATGPAARTVPAPAPAPAPTAVPAPRQGRAPGAGIRSTTPETRPSLDRETAEEDESVDALAWSPISDPFASGDEPGLFPEASGLSGEQQDRFAAWLAEETRRVKGGSA